MYVIKEVVAGIASSYVVTGSDVLNNGFSFTTELAQATAFSSLVAAIQAIVDRTVYVVGAEPRRPLAKFTVVGIEKVVPQPEFREVSL